MKTSYFVSINKGTFVFIFLLFLFQQRNCVAQIVTKKYKPGATIGEDAQLWTTYGCTPSGYTTAPETINGGSSDELDIMDWTFRYMSCGRGTRRGILRFSELNSLPAGTIKLLDAQLKLHCVESSANWGTSTFSSSPYTLDNPGWVERVTGSWSETTVTWDSQPTTTSYNRAEIPKSTAKWGWKTTIDVTDLINDILASGSNNGLMLKLQTEAYYRATLFGTSDHADSTLWPELIIIYDSLCSSVLARFKDTAINCKQVKFTDISSVSSGTIVSWKWDFGDGDTSILQNPIHNYAAFGTYTVRLIVENSLGCKDTFTRNVNGSAVKFANFKDSATSCFQIQFLDKSTILSGVSSWKWDFGDGTFSTAQNPLHTFPYYGIFKVSFVSKNSTGCTDTFVKNIEIKRNYFASFSDSITSCFQIQFKDKSNPTIGGSLVSWKWDFGDGSVSINQNPLHTFPTYGAYKVRLIVENTRGCVDTIVKTVNISYRHFVDAGRDTSVCMVNDEANIELNATKGLHSYSWLPTTGLSNPFSATTHATMIATTTYLVKATDSLGCKDSAFVTIIVHPKVEITARPKDTAVCFDTKIQLDADGGATYQWMPTKGLDNPNSNSPKLNVSEDATYIVKGTDPNGCFSFDTIQVHLLPAATITASPKNAFVCYGGKIDLLAIGGKYYKWTPATGLNNDSIATPQATIYQPTTYTLMGKDSTGCPGYDSVLINLYPSPKITATSTENIIHCKAKDIRLEAYGAISYTWAPAEYCDNYTSSSPLVTPPKTTLFTVTGTDQNGCQGHDTISVLYVSKAEVFLPNAFTPNADQRNDVFRIIDVCNFTLSSFDVFARWGEHLFSTNDINAGWDGNYKGRPTELGVYFYLIKGKTLDGEEVLFKGDFTLIR